MPAKLRKGLEALGEKFPSAPPPLRGVGGPSIGAMRQGPAPPNVFYDP